LWDDAIALYRQARAASERAGRPADGAFTDYNVGEILADQGHFDEADGYLQRARRIWSATGERQGVAEVEMLLGRLAMRRGRYQDALPVLEAARADLRRFAMDASADLALALIAEAEAFLGDPQRALQIARQELEAGQRNRPLIERVAGIALARLGETDAAKSKLMDALASARERDAEYDIAATIDVLDALGSIDSRMLADRDEIIGRLKIARLPAPLLA
jgi:tetratricopeptide (TPR) repeat protein